MGNAIDPVTTQVVGNLIKPGDGLHIDDATANLGQQQAADAGSTTDVLLGIIPTSLFSSLTSGEVLETLLVALLVGFAIQRMGAAGSRSWWASGTCSGWCSASSR